MWAHLYELAQAFLKTPFAVGAVSSWLMVALVDYQAFLKFKNIHDAAEYQWGTAIFRWVQAFIGGGLGASIFKGMVG